MTFSYQLLTNPGDEHWSSDPSDSASDTSSASGEHDLEHAEIHGPGTGTL